MTKRTNRHDRKRERKFSNGRDWQALAQDKRGSNPAPGRTTVRTGLPSPTWRTINNPINPDPGGITYFDPSLIVQHAQAMRDIIDKQILNNIYGIPIRDLLTEPTRPPLTREMKVGEIIGYRCWRLENGILRSTYQGDFWEPRHVMVGRELSDWDTRGIHAWKEPNSRPFNDYVREYLERDRSPFSRCLYMDPVSEPPPTVIVTGSIFLWGDVVEHEHGYRGEYASIRSIDWLYPDASLMGRERETIYNLRERYCVPHRVPNV